MVSEYEGMKRACFDFEGSIGMFLPVCPNCARFVKADDCFLVNGVGGVADEPNATCSKCGRIKMEFEGFYDPEELEE